MAAAKKPFLVPYDRFGGIMAYPEHSFSHWISRANGGRYEYGSLQGMDYEARAALDLRPVYNEPEMRPNDPWSGTLRLDDFMRGRSAARFIWYADGDPVDQRRTYPMFMVDMLELVKTQGVQPGGLVHGRWTVAKRGANFGIKLVTE